MNKLFLQLELIRFLNYWWESTYTEALHGQSKHIVFSILSSKKKNVSLKFKIWLTSKSRHGYQLTFKEMSVMLLKIIVQRKASVNHDSGGHFFHETALQTFWLFRNTNEFPSICLYQLTFACHCCLVYSISVQLVVFLEIFPVSLCMFSFLFNQYWQSSSVYNLTNNIPVFLYIWHLFNILQERWLIRWCSWVLFLPFGIKGNEEFSFAADFLWIKGNKCFTDA